MLVLIPVKDLECGKVRSYADEKYQKALYAGEMDLSDFKIELTPFELESMIGKYSFK